MVRHVAPGQILKKVMGFNMKFGHLERAHRVLCDIASASTGFNRELLLESVRDIEAFTMLAGKSDVLNRLHATRHTYLPETGGQK